MAIQRRDFLKQSAAIGATVAGGLYLASPAKSSQKCEAPLRPPGALPEDQFTATCIRCMRCVDACPNHAIKSLPLNSPNATSGTPTLHMREAACMLCAIEEGDYLKCTESCPSGALQLVKKTPEEIKAKVSMGVAQIDLDLCYSYNNWSCGACYRACPLAGEAMTVGSWEKPMVHPEACVGCGCCERSCIRYPHAIRVKVEERA